MVEEDAIVERKTGLIKRKRLVLVRGSGGDYLNEYFQGWYLGRQICEIVCEEDATAFGPFICSSRASGPCW